MTQELYGYRSDVYYLILNDQWPKSYLNSYFRSAAFSGRDGAVKPLVLRKPFRTVGLMRISDTLMKRSGKLPMRRFATYHTWTTVGKSVCSIFEPARCWTLIRALEHT